MDRFPLTTPLPPEADPAIDVVRTLRDAGHTALLAGGCVRDLLRGATPSDFDVATDAPPDRVAALFRGTRHVGATFGVVLVKSKRVWVEVATFRSDGEYRDGRRPESVTFSDAEHDALRRDFTVNGMFLDPLAMTVIDYVGGRADLDAGRIRAIGDPAQRFAEDHLRLVRAIRFAARLRFSIEERTADALRRFADRLRDVASERVREELDKMLSHETRAVAVDLALETGLLPQFCPAAPLNADDVRAALPILRRLSADADFTLSLAVLAAGYGASAVRQVDRDCDLDGLCRGLRCSNQQRDAIVWLFANRAKLDEPARPTLAELKRLLAGSAFDSLRQWALARYADFPDGCARQAALAARIASIAPETICPAPFITGDDLLSHRVPQGPDYKRILDELYTRQLNEEMTTRDAALSALSQMLKGRDK